MKTPRKLATLLALVFSTQVGAAVVFTFDSTVLSGNSGNGLGATGGNSAIATSMNSQLAAANYVGAAVSVTGALATRTYSGEGHVAGSTLGPDTFIINNGFGIGAGTSDSFTLAFTGLLIESIAFDWEIFPNAECPAHTTCATHSNNSSFPDLTVTARNGAAASVQVFHTIANLGNNTLDPQAIGTSGTILLTGFSGLSAGATSLTFIDWPAEIGIDNLSITTSCTAGNSGCATGRDVPLPEPSSTALTLLGLGLLSGTLMRRGYANRR